MIQVEVIRLLKQVKTDLKGGIEFRNYLGKGLCGYFAEYFYPTRTFN